MTDAAHLIEKAGQCIAAEDWAGAAAAFESVAAQSPAMRAAIAYNCGVAHRRAGAAAAALAWLDAALAADPAHDNALFERAAALVDLARLNDALAAIDLYLSRAGGDPDALRTRARLLLALGRWEDAAQAWERVAVEASCDAEAELAKLRILAETGRHDAVLDCAKALLRDGEIPPVAVLHELTHAGSGTIPFEIARLRD